MAKPAPTLNQIKGTRQKADAKKTLGKVKKAFTVFSIWGEIRKNKALLKKHRSILKPSYNAGRILVAGVFFLDILTLILGLLGIGEVLDSIIDFFEAWILPIPYKLLGLKFQFDSYIGAAILELIPFVNLLPIWTVQAIFTLYTTWLPQITEAEEAEKKAAAEKAKMQAEAEIMQKEEMNQAADEEAAGEAGGVHYRSDGTVIGNYQKPEEEKKTQQGLYFGRAGTTGNFSGAAGQASNTPTSELPAPGRIAAPSEDAEKILKGTSFKPGGIRQDATKSKAA